MNQAKQLAQWEVKLIDRVVKVLSRGACHLERDDGAKNNSEVNGVYLSPSECKFIAQILKRHIDSPN